MKVCIGSRDKWTVLLVERRFLFTSVMWNLGGVVRQGLSNGCVMMGTRREIALFSVVVASTAGLTIDASVHALKMNRWKMCRQPLRGCRTDECPDGLVGASSFRC